MRKPTSIFWINLLLISIVVVFTLAALSLKSNFQQSPKSPNQIDAYAKNVTIHAYRADGQLSSILKTPYVQHFQTDNRAKFSNPHVTMHPSSGLPWTLTADHGSSRNGNDWIKLTKNVHISQTQSGNTLPTNMFTQSLIIENTKNLAYTSDPVEIKRPDSIVHAIGMRTNLKTGDVIFLSHVHGVYYANHN